MTGIPGKHVSELLEFVWILKKKQKNLGGIMEKNLICYFAVVVVVVVVIIYIVCIV